jgi:hypothetical protein
MSDTNVDPAPVITSELALPPPPSVQPAQPATSSPPAPSLTTLKSWLPLYLTKTDRLLTHLHRILSTPSGTDSALLAVGYTSLATSSLLSLLASPPPLARLSVRRLAVLYALISDVRMFARLWGLLGIWQWGKSVLLAPPADTIERQIVQIQVLVNVAYQVLENGAYLSSKGVLGWSKEKQGKAWMWSSRFWAAHVGLEFWRLAREKESRRKRVVGEKELESLEEVKARDVAWKRDVLINLGYAPMTLHWSAKDGIISPLTVGLLGTFVGLIKMTRLWEATA